VLSGNSAANSLTGGAGNDTYYVGTGDTVTEAASAGTDTVMSSITWTLGSNLENLTLTGATAINATGNTLDNVLNGNTANNTLTGGTGNDTYRGGAGTDTLSDTSTTSNEIYQWGRGEGTDVLTDAGGADRLDVFAGVASDQMWLRHVGNNLELSVIGTSDAFTINGWYTSAASQVESFRLADGKTLTASRVQQLVDAMASFAPPAAGQTTLPPSYQSSLQPVIAANWV
jgi:Ca2+-binding RTX toxin-like protein